LQAAAAAALLLSLSKGSSDLDVNTMPLSPPVALDENIVSLNAQKLQENRNISVFLLTARI
jgi:hypothetical protein